MEGTPVEVFAGRGARAVEARLLAEVTDWHRAVRAEPARLSHPLAIVVPSKSLKQHVSATLVREIGTLAGVAVQTHHSVALQVLEAAGRRPPVASELVPVLVRQHARGAKGLAALDALVDGHGAVSAVVSDLLDAGLDATTAEPVREFFLEMGGPAASQGQPRGTSWQRAAGIVEVALAVQAELDRSGLGRVADVVRAARETLESDPARFAAGRVVLHGFSDATGIVTDFLRVLLAGRSGLVLLDRPPDPVDPDRPDLGVAFTRRFEERISARVPETETDGPKQPRPSFFRAPGTDAEVREVARRILLRRDAGASWESIGVVARAPALYAAALRVHFGRLGIPFSGVGLAGPRSMVGRRSAFLIELLRQAGRLPADRFVAALGGIAATRRDDLRLGLHALGVARLGELAELDVASALRGGDRLPLPVRRGLAAATGEDGNSDDEDSDEPQGAEGEASPSETSSAPLGGPRASRRSLHRETLEGGVARAHRVADFLASADLSRPIGERIGELAAVARDALGWGAFPGDPAGAGPGDPSPLLRRLEALARELPADLPVRLDELALVLDRALQRGAHDAIGGGGGGVQVLDVVEARARTFGHLFLLGLNRDLFPRIVSDDPLLPDEVRRPLQAVLPELPVKERGHDEERFLFAQLVSSSADVTISWQVLGDDGKAKSASPLVDRMLPADPDAQPELVPTLLVPEDGEDVALRPAHEWALLAGLHGDAKQVHALLPSAVAEASQVSAEHADALAAIRARVIAEVDGPRRADPLLGPYFGHVGPVADAADLRRGVLWVTTAERIARCPWQGFLTRMLRLERPPDALEALPEANGLLDGNVVHAVLERIVTDAIADASHPDRLREALPVLVDWPAKDRLLAWTEQEARRVCFEAGIGVPGFAELLAERLTPYLDAARLADWAEGPVPVVGVELEVSVEVATLGGPRELRFRADRVDRLPDGLRLTDYKTGNTIKDARKADTRTEGFSKKIASGLSLQAAAYERTAVDAQGRLLFVKPEVNDDSRIFQVTASEEDESLRRAFDAAVGRITAASDQGTFVPRLIDAQNGDEPDTCKWCEVSLACLRGDSGARRRLGDWSAALAGSDDDSPRAQALRGVWKIGGDDV